MHQETIKRKSCHLLYCYGCLVVAVWNPLPGVSQACLGGPSAALFGWQSPPRMPLPAAGAHSALLPQFSSVQFSSVQSLSCVWLFATPWTAAHQASLSITNSWSLLQLMSIESVMPSNHLILCRPFLLFPSIFPSIRVFSNESVLHIRRFSFSISPSNEYPGLIFFRMDWFDLLVAHGTLKSLLQHHSSKAWVFVTQFSS